MSVSVITADLQPPLRFRRAKVGRNWGMTVTTPPTLRQLVTRSDDHPALVVPESGASLSYAALKRALDRAAGRLAALGVREGDRVALVAANGPALVIAFLAVAARGAATAPLNPALGVAEMTAELDDLRITRLLHDGSAAAATAAAETQVPASSMGMRDALLQVDDEAGEPVEDAGDPGALALLLHTSGTTSKPKTVPIRQRNLIAATGVIARGDRRHCRAAAVPAVHVLGRRRQPRRDLVHGGPDHPRAAAHAGPRTARGAEAQPQVSPPPL